MNIISIPPDYSRIGSTSYSSYIAKEIHAGMAVNSIIYKETVKKLLFVDNRLLKFTTAMLASYATTMSTIDSKYLICLILEIFSYS